MPDDNKEKEEVEVEGAEESKKPFESLDLKRISLFGGGPWTKLATQSKTLGWDGIDKLALEKNLARSTDACYFRIVSFVVEDLDNEIRWHASFLNDKGLWELEIDGSPDAEVEPEQMADFFGSEEFKKIAKRAGWLLEEARSLVQDVLQEHIDNGQLLAVDEVKLEAIMHWLGDKQFMENLRSGKFMNA